MIDVRIPKGGMSTVEVDVVAVHVTPGDTVARGAVLVEVESEKATFEVECGEAGIVREVLVQVGDVMNVGDVVARLDPTPGLAGGA
jgi:pyruvate/2-oxoglutarate dehydrogenase complex dihydrolipoamide acyltransferase (E2) component